MRVGKAPRAHKTGHIRKSYSKHGPPSRKGGAKPLHEAKPVMADIISSVAAKRKKL